MHCTILILSPQEIKITVGKRKGILLAVESSYLLTKKHTKRKTMEQVKYLGPGMNISMPPTSQILAFLVCSSTLELLAIQGCKYRECHSNALLKTSRCSQSVQVF